MERKPKVDTHWEKPLCIKKIQQKIGKAEETVPEAFAMYKKILTLIDPSANCAWRSYSD